METRKVKKSKQFYNTYDVFSQEGVKVYSFYFYRDKHQGATNFLIKNDGSQLTCYYAYFAEMKRDAVSGWLEMGRINPVQVSMDDYIKS